MLRTTISPTQIVASGKRNVIPGVCEIVCDCRILPGESQSEVEALIREKLGRDGYELEWLGAAEGGTRSAFETPLWEASSRSSPRRTRRRRSCRCCFPGSPTATSCARAFGTIAYGFFPMRAMDADLAARLVHSADERAAVDDLELGTRFLVHAARELCGSATPEWIAGSAAGAGS